MGSEGTYGGLVNKKKLPMLFMSLGLLFVLLSFLVGWYSVDAKLTRWPYDENEPDRDFAGAVTLGPPWVIDMEMLMLSIETHGKPVIIEQVLEQRGGAPTYDEHAGRMGTVMLGMLFIQFAVLVAFAATFGFYLMHRRRKGDYANVTKRLFVVLVAIMGLGMAYFMLRIGPSAQSDAEVILEEYRFSDQVAYAAPEPDLGFWKTWTSDRETVPIGDGREVWQFEIASRPSAGWWLSTAALGFVIAGRVVAARNGEFDDLDPLAPPAPPQPLAG